MNPRGTITLAPANTVLSTTSTIPAVFTLSAVPVRGALTITAQLTDFTAASCNLAQSSFVVPTTAVSTTVPFTLTTGTITGKLVIVVTLSGSSVEFMKVAPTPYYVLTNSTVGLLSPPSMFFNTVQQFSIFAGYPVAAGKSLTVSITAQTDGTLQVARVRPSVSSFFIEPS